ncbi:LLM class flavin-dependent oxidoreductase [Actinocorallia sp. A-T 12471]|uniref:LLM class flavin-dependent oxidoreductase n=1 Tax=Actinocorallia sp. A-T 12471 TaxID=3089813 RepID=UPI0029D23AA2|nr:LLM class flavin-dependent oxidoreductase [Actinocorallia sp. A-T 12471]MDX6743564.1 LLM class flavin-dependent oxidoreductase [Actinocorallia sp. A-T 12471]
MSTRRLHLNAFVMGVGHHEAAWRHPRTDAAHTIDLAHYQRIARKAEEGKLDSIFFADGVALYGNVRYNALDQFEPLTLLAAIAAVTERIGLIATASTTYNEPYNLARKFASLDHISGGRAGWNIVTSASEAEAHNFGIDRPDHSDRYARADDFVEAALKLWDSWEDDAVLRDVGRGIFADTGKIHEIAHEGPYYRVKGPLNISRGPQGRPLLVQAGSSETGKEFAARWAEAVFTAQQTLAEGKAFYADLKGRLARYGRSEDELLVLPGISPFIGSTEAEAKRLEEEFQELINPEYGLTQLSHMTGLDLSGHPLDGPLPDDLPESTEGNRSRFDLVIGLARREGLTIRQLIARLAGGRGHRVVAGSPEQVADQIQEWFENGAADGFNVMPPHYPQGLDDFVDHVVPILRERGLFRSEYEGATLRENYGLARPDSRYAGRSGAAHEEAGVPS